MKQKISIFDSTLRDGAQARGISFSVKDRLAIMHQLDDMHVDYIEAGNPASNPKERDFFNAMENHTLKNAKLTAFGSTRRKGVAPADDAGVKMLLGANTQTVAIFGKTWDLHVEKILGATLEENLEMVYDTVKFFVDKDIEVVFDAEHFFDGYKNNPDYAMKVLEAAVHGGSSWLVLCDTNGGAMPFEVANATQKSVERFSVPIGIHTHDDTGMAVANSIMAVKGGATQVQGTLIGFGERCGNATLTSVIPNLQLKMNYQCIPDQYINQLTSIARFVADVSNISLNQKMPYVGRDAFSHKGGMHIDGVQKVQKSFEHINPEKVGNERSFLLSEVAGRSALVLKMQKTYPELTRKSPEITELIETLKQMENEGYQFEGAESTFEVMISKKLGKNKIYFEIEHYKVIDESDNDEDGITAYAIVKINIHGQNRMAAAEGNGPVNALDQALRNALKEFYPALENVHLTDYKVRVLNSTAATAARVRVLIESTDRKQQWTTVGVSENIIEASMRALVDSIEYKLMTDEEKKNAE
jgi:2-isopropylmalate synthase